MKWFIDKGSKVPFYLQLKDLLKYYISTGTIENRERLPTVKDLAKTLEINFETVRKAYKELEREGLVSCGRGRGTFANGHGTSRSIPTGNNDYDSDLTDSIKSLIRRFLQHDIDPQDIRRTFDQSLSEICSENPKEIVVFTECNQLQIREISELLRLHLDLDVRPVLVEELREEVEKIQSNKGRIKAVLTTGFHITEVRNALAHITVKIDFLITNMSTETRRALDAFDKSSRFGFICRDQESISFYREMLSAELGIRSSIPCCILAEESRVKDLIDSVDVLLVSPPVYDDIKRMAPPSLPVFNVFDRVDPMSLKVVKEGILEGK